MAVNDIIDGALLVIGIAGFVGSLLGAHLSMSADADGVRLAGRNDRLIAAAGYLLLVWWGRRVCWAPERTPRMKLAGETWLSGLADHARGVAGSSGAFPSQDVST